MHLRIYGHPASQPSRTVFWACLLNGQPFQLGNSPQELIGRRDGNPRGQIPWMEDDQVTLAEAPAIVGYLAQRHRWPRLIPADPIVAARVQQFLHMQHTLLRMATWRLMAAHVVKPLDMPTRSPNPLSLVATDQIGRGFAEDDPHRAGGQVVAAIADFLDHHYFEDGQPYLCGSEEASVADLVGYAELGQLVFANLFDFTPYPRIQRWLAAMRTLPQHDAIHAYNMALGDIRTRPNTMQRFLAAGRAGFDALLASGLVESASASEEEGRHGSGA